MIKHAKEIDQDKLAANRPQEDKETAQPVIKKLADKQTGLKNTEKGNFYECQVSGASAFYIRCNIISFILTSYVILPDRL